MSIVCYGCHGALGDDFIACPQCGTLVCNGCAAQNGWKCPCCEGMLLENN